MMQKLQKILAVTGFFLVGSLHGATEDPAINLLERKIQSDQRLVSKASKLHAAVQSLQLNYVYPVLDGTEGTSFSCDARYAALSELSKVLSKNILPLQAATEVPSSKKLQKIAASIRAGIHSYYQVSRQHYADMAITIEDPVIVIPCEMEALEKRCARILQPKESQSIEK